MELQKINVKFFTTEAVGPPLADFISVFHDWIQATNGVYHDVADYSHMQASPGIVLVANDANISIDETGSRRGLLFNQKAPLRGSNQERLLTVLRAALETCRRLEHDPALTGKLKFSGSEALFTINDRLIAPNTEDSFEKIKPEIQSVATILFDDADISLGRDEDPRKRLNIGIKTSRAIGVDTLLSNLQKAKGGEGKQYATGNDRQ